MRCRVLRAISGLDALPGTIVETATWRLQNVKGLIAMRYLQPLPDETAQEMSGPAPSPAGTLPRADSARRRA